jgi:hypothetical protein
MELDAPGRVPEPVGLEADRIAGERHGSVRKLERVLVPLEGLEARGDAGEDWIAFRIGRQLDLVPAYLLIRGGPDVGTGCLRDQLAAQANPEHRHLLDEKALDQRVLFAEPRVVVLLVHVHSASEDEHRIEALGRRRRKAVDEVPLQELAVPLANRVGEGARGGVVLMDQREHAHSPSLGGVDGTLLVIGVRWS